MNEFVAIAPDVKLGENVRIARFVNLYGCRIGGESKIGTFVEVQKDASIGRNCKLSSHSFVCSGVDIGDNCFIGHGVMFINDNHPRSVNGRGELEDESDWAGRFVRTVVESNVTIGSGATIKGAITIGRGAVIGAGSMVTRDVPPNEIWAGNPARCLKKRDTRY